MSRFFPFALPFAIACGGQTTTDIPPSASDFPPPSADAVSYDNRLGTQADVSGGRARIGGWWLVNSATSLDVTPLACSGAEAASAVSPFDFGAEVIVAPFRLMTTEVTNEAYAVCVDSGGCVQPDIPRPDFVDWRSPDVAHQPVLATWSLAHTFCRHYGGDLPTAGEYARATVGDSETYAQGAMLSVALQCVHTQSGPNPVGDECKKLQGYGPLADAGSDPNDVGPFGHVDLYGNAWEWVRGYFDEGSTSFCASPLYEHDIHLTFPDPSAQDSSAFPPNATVYSPEKGMSIPVSTDLSHAVAPDLAVHDPQQDTSGLNFFGFRCAFPKP